MCAKGHSYCRRSERLRRGTPPIPGAVIAFPVWGATEVVDLGGVVWEGGLCSWVLGFWEGTGHTWEDARCSGGAGLEGRDLRVLSHSSLPMALRSLTSSLSLTHRAHGLAECFNFNFF